ncbi:UbiA family prenyltransferase [Amorphoplanes nipponensis]
MLSGAEVPVQRTLSFPAKIAACFAEARLQVQVIFLLRLLAGFGLGRPAGVAFPWLRLFGSIAVWELAVLSVYLADGVMDIVEDRLNGSTRPIARGDLPRGFAAVVAVAAGVLSVLGAARLGAPYIFLVPVMVLLGYAYCSPPARLKRWSGAAGAIVVVAGLLTFAAGSAVWGPLRPTAPLIIFALVMSVWMGLVGALAKDFSDVDGDAVAGCRTTASTRHGRAVRLVVGNALVVAGGFGLAAFTIAPVLRPSSLIMMAGAWCVVFTTIAFAAAPERHRRRRPYKAFMLTQYAVHAAILIDVFLLLT